MRGDIIQRREEEKKHTKLAVETAIVVFEVLWCVGRWPVLWLGGVPSPTLMVGDVGVDWKLAECGNQ